MASNPHTTEAGMHSFVGMLRTYYLAAIGLSAYGNAKSRGSVRVGDVRRARRLAGRIREALR